MNPSSLAHRSHGAVPVSAEQTRFRVWAPSHPQVAIATPEKADHPLAPSNGGWHEALLPLPAGTRYRCVLGSGSKRVEVPDPASNAQDGDVHGHSVVVDHRSYLWQNPEWRGRPWHEAVIYELHPGLFGGFEGIEAKLPELAALGVTAVELMPVADFPGSRNWGYDGVLPYAPDASYGSPEQLKHLVDTAHGLGLMLFLDVVYNHFGPDGNYLGTVAPEFFRDDVHTPWGSAIDFRRPEVRSFFTENAIQWIRDYRFDGLRFDAVHAITESDWLDEMARAVRAAAGPDRHVHLVLENDDNNADHLRPERRCFDAQWNDDAHHVLHVLLTDETDGYYTDYAQAPAAQLARVLREGFAYQGEPSAHRKGETRGTPSGFLPPTAFVDCLQNHDQIGNRPLGERLTSLSDPDALHAATALLLLSPHIPLIFMGEESGSCDPFLYFTSHGDELAKLVKEGRRNEFAGFARFADEKARAEIPDPNDPRTFEASRLRGRDSAQAHRALYQRLLTLRRDHLVPGLDGCRAIASQVLGPKAVSASWRLANGAVLTIAINLDLAPVAWPDRPDPQHLLYASGAVTTETLAGRCTLVYLAPPLPEDLAQLATETGVNLEWADYLGRPKFLSEETVRRTLSALGLPCSGAGQIAASRAALDASRAAPLLRTAKVNDSLAIPLSANPAPSRLRGEIRLESGETRPLEVSLDGASARFAVGDEPGYHRVELCVDEARIEFSLAVAPLRAHGSELTRCWGTAVQLYSLRVESDRADRDVGIGDYTALAAFAARAGQSGAQAIAVSPVHAGFAAEPTRFSPYSPSSRLFHNVLYIDPVAEFGREFALSAATSAGLDDLLDGLGGASEIDWQRSGQAKSRWLRAVFDRLDSASTDAPDPVGETALLNHATFEALHAHFLAQGRSSWRDWPDEFKAPQSAAVADFARAHAVEVRFHAWLQRLADRGLGRAQAAARAAGMQVGLIADLAIGMATDGSHAWASQDEVVSGLEIGAPPDLLNRRGQAWGLTTFSARGLKTAGFGPFIATLRAAMRHAGGVRIDHVLGLRRLWLIPSGLAPSEGAYVELPFEDLLNLVVLESQRNRALVIGEDLGTVPAGLQDTLAERGIFGMSVLWFELAGGDGGFTPPDAWRPATVAMTTTHDLPTAAGWWRGRDIDWRGRLKLEPKPDAALAERDRHRQALSALGPQVDPGSDGVDLAIEIVAAASSPLAIVPIEDLLGLEEQPNFPGTLDEHPNWRQRLPLSTDRLFEAAQVVRRVDRLNSLRPTASRRT